MADIEELEASARGAAERGDGLAQQNQPAAAGAAYDAAGRNYEQGAEAEAGEANRAGDTRAGCVYRCKAARLYELAAESRAKAAAQYQAAGAARRTAQDTSEGFAQQDYQSAAETYEKCATCRSARDHHATAAEAYGKASGCWGKVKAIYKAWETEMDAAADHATTEGRKAEAQSAASSHHEHANEAERREKDAARKEKAEKDS
jgi:hypothetical protein